MKRIISILTLVFCGCASTFYTSVDGENDAIGIKLPSSSGVNFEALHHLNGSMVSVKEPAEITHEYWCVNSNTYFGCITISENRHGKISIMPEKKVKND